MDRGGYNGRSFHRSIVPSFRSRHNPRCRYESHRLPRRHDAPQRPPYGCVLAILLIARLGTGRHRSSRHRRRFRRVGGRDGDDDAEGATGGELLERDPFDESESQTAGSAGLARALDFQSPLFRRGSVRLRAPARFSSESEDAGAPEWERNRHQHSVTVNTAPLGVFDSGIGGLTVARALFERLPKESVIYFGDTARVPYGPKSPDTVRRYSAEILTFLLRRGVKAVVIACNTSTAHALAHLQAQSRVPVVGVIEPGARAAVAATKTGTIGVIGTAGTVASGAYERAIRALRPSADVHSQPCPLFVPLVEEGWFEHPATELAAREYLDPLRRAGVDVLVLGCTHYPLLKPLLGRVMGAGVTLIDSAAETAKAVTRELAARGLDAPAANSPEHLFVVSDDEPHFRKVGATFLGETLRKVEVVPLG